MELFTLCREVYNEKRKIVIYGFHSFTKESLIFLAMHDIYVYAFLSESSHFSCGGGYLGKKVITIEELHEEYSVYDLFGDNICLLKKRGIEAKQLLLCNAGKNVVLYGAGAYGCVCYEILQKYSVNVLAFCDWDKDKIGSQYFGCEVISKDRLDAYADRADLVIALDVYQAETLQDEFRISFDGNRVFYNNWSKYYICAGNILDPFYIFYLRHRYHKITMMGYMDDILEISKILRLFDISISRAVDHNGYIGERDAIKFVDKYDLVYDDESVFYCVMENGKDLAGKFMEELGDRRSRFLFEFRKTIGSFDVVLDANMGYNKQESIHILEAGNGRGLKIGILGGSTSDIDLYGEASWAECLRNILEEKNINASLYVGAEQGFTSSQELLKLCRDMILYQPDIVISYSGVNDCPKMTSRKNIFISHWQEELFAAIMQSSVDIKRSKYIEGIKKAFCYGTANSNYCEGWFRNERMMHGICSEYGISFYAILQPNIFSRDACSHTEREVLEMTRLMFEKADVLEYIQNTNEKCEKIKKMDFAWMYDFSRVFDGYAGITYFDKCHLFEEANFYLAFQIFELIKNDIDNYYKKKI